MSANRPGKSSSNVLPAADCGSVQGQQQVALFCFFYNKLLGLLVCREIMLGINNTGISSHPIQRVH